MTQTRSMNLIVGSVAALGILTCSIVPVQAGGGGEIRLKADMVSGAASGKADYRERGNRRRLNVEAEDLPGTTASTLMVFVNNAPVGNMNLATCPPPAVQLLCGELELNTQDGQQVPVVTAGQIVSVGLNPSVLSGTFR